MVKLIDEGADPHEVDISGENILFDLCKNGYYHIVHALIRDYDVDSHILNQNRQTSLFRACEQKNLELVSLLIDMGCDPNHLDNYNETPFIRAVSFGNLSIMKYLYDNYQVDIETENMYGLTPYDVAKLKRRPPVIAFFSNIEKGKCAPQVGRKKLVLQTPREQKAHIIKEWGLKVFDNELKDYRWANNSEFDALLTMKPELK